METTGAEDLLGAIVLHTVESMDSLKKEFDVRLRVQKIVYLLQLHPAFKRWFSYSFGFYIRGPYSPDLASAYYSLQEKQYTLPQLPTEAREYLDLISGSDSETLELIASIIEVMRNSPRAGKEAVVSKVHQLKPYYGQERTRAAFDEALSWKEKYHLTF